jgi:signal transduction histidine kinase
MTQVREELRHHRPSWLSVPFVVGMVCLAALLLLGLLWAVQGALELPAPLVADPTWWVLAVCVVAAAVSDVIYVPIRHADAWEEATFVEVVLIWAVVLLPPFWAVSCVLGGFFLSEMLARRPWVKSLFNLASYAVSTAALMIFYYVLAGDSGPFSLRSIVALVLGAAVFAALNLLMLSLVLLAAEGVPPREFLSEQWALSVWMALGSVGIATVALSIEENTPLLLPFAALPAVAMWYVYRASSSHAAARERSKWLVQLGQAVASPGTADAVIPRAAEALRRVYGADDYTVRMPDGSLFGSAVRWDAPSVGQREAVELTGVNLPEGWTSGIAVGLDSQAGRGLLAIGSVADQPARTRSLPRARSWAVPETDKPGLVALTAAVSSALRAGQTLAALTAETAKLQAVVDHSTDGICVVDGRGEILLWSPAAQRITGVSVDAEPLPDIAAQIVALPASTQGHALEFERADGQTVSLQVIRVDVYGSVATSVITIRDMTRERRAERLKSDFIATISHELRTPITPIRGYADLLKRRWDRMSEEKRASVLDTIEERADHLARLVDDLLMAARTETDTALRVDAASVNLVDVVAEAATGFPEIDGRLTIDESPPRMVVADRTRVVQIISNLVGNALKYTPAGSPIEISFGSEADMVLVEVTDHGPGIAADEQEKVFERFYRIEDPLTMRTGGSGLGLHISRQLARAMGGDVTLKSSPGQGSTFILRLRAEG